MSAASRRTGMVARVPGVVAELTVLGRHLKSEIVESMEARVWRTMRTLLRYWFERHQSLLMASKGEREWRRGRVWACRG